MTRLTEARLSRVSFILVTMSLSVCLITEPAGAKGLQSSTKMNKYPFAGYITPPGTFTSTSATVVLPTPTCTRRTAAVTAAAVLYNSSTNAFSSAMTYVGCSGKHSVFSALVQIDNAFTFPTVNMHAGDTISLTVTCGVSGISVSIDDKTTTSVGSGSSATAETCTQAEVGNDATAFKNGSIAPLPKFVSMSFTNVMANGAAIGSFSPSASTYFEGKKNVITSGPLTSGGTSFTTTQG